MGKKAKTGKHRQDKFYHLAKEQGFRSRASFKLVQLNKRFDFLSSAARGVLDLCAAPGGWMQIARKHMPLDAPCIGIDLVPIRPIPGCSSIVGDITTDSCRVEIRRKLKAHSGACSDAKVDVVLSDGSPNMGQTWLQDAYTQSELTLAAIRLATEFLAPGGCFVTKVFRSNDYNSLMFVMNQFFGKVNATKPSASRAESAEIYVLCTGFRAPKAIDSRLLNPKHVFRDMGSAAAEGTTEDGDIAKKDLVLNTVLKGMAKRKRHRDGYADGDLTLYKRVSALEFARTPRPVAMICEVSAFSLSSKDVSESRDLPACDVARAMPETTSEVLHCFEDLKVLGRQEFKLLLKWRLAARTALSALGLLTHGGTGQSDEEKQASKQHEACAEDSAGSSEGSDQGLDDELRDARAILEAKEKRKKRKSNKLRNSLQRKIDMKIVLPDDEFDIDGEDTAGLFRLSTATRAENRGAGILDIDPSADADDECEEVEIDNGSVPLLPYELKDLSESKADEEKVLNDELDHWYKVYLTRKKRDKNGILLQESKERKRWTKRRALRDAQEAAQDGEKNETGPVDDTLGDNVARVEIVSSASSEEGSDMDEDVNFGKMPPSSREAALWFSQSVFAGALSSDEDEDVRNENPANSVRRPSLNLRSDDDAVDLRYDVETNVEDIHGAARREARGKAAQIAQEKSTDGFEVVPTQSATPDSDSSGNSSEGKATDNASESSFHSSDYDTDEKAEMLAIGRRMRESSKEATEVLDDAYNRYTFDDPPDLPRWFADPDPVYRARQAPLVTKEQVSEMKAYIKSLQAAPCKKVAEAKARKKARVAKRIELMKTKANTIAEQRDVPAASRMKAIEALYRQASKSSKSKKRSKQYVVVQAGGSKKVVGGDKKDKSRRGSKAVSTVLVDKRMKSDKRGIAKAKRKQISKRK